MKTEKYAKVLNEFQEWLDRKIAEEDIPSDVVVLKMPAFIKTFLKQLS